MLQITMFNGMNRQQVVCLVDSGADECPFHASIGRHLGIHVSSGLFKKFDGIADSIDAYMHTIEIQVQDFEERVKIQAGFTESDGVYAILGQAGFFENYKVTFERYRWKMEVTSRSDI